MRFQKMAMEVWKKLCQQFLPLFGARLLSYLILLCSLMLMGPVFSVSMVKLSTLRAADTAGRMLTLSAAAIALSFMALCALCLLALMSYGRSCMVLRLLREQPVRLEQVFQGFRELRQLGGICVLYGLYQAVLLGCAALLWIFGAGLSPLGLLGLGQLVMALQLLALMPLQLALFAGVERQARTAGQLLRYGFAVLRTQRAQLGYFVLTLLCFALLRNIIMAFSLIFGLFFTILLDLYSACLLAALYQQHRGRDFSPECF